MASKKDMRREDLSKRPSLEWTVRAKSLNVVQLSPTWSPRPRMILEILPVPHDLRAESVNRNAFLTFILLGAVGSTLPMAAVSHLFVRPHHVT